MYIYIWGILTQTIVVSPTIKPYRLLSSYLGPCEKATNNRKDMYHIETICVTCLCVCVIHPSIPPSLPPSIHPSIRLYVRRSVIYVDKRHTLFLRCTLFDFWFEEPLRRSRKPFRELSSVGCTVGLLGGSGDLESSSVIDCYVT